MDFKRIAAVFSLTLCGLLLACMTVWVTAEASEGVSGLNASSSEPEQMVLADSDVSQGIFVEGYDCYTTSDPATRAPINQITPGMSFYIEVYMVDTRPEVVFPNTDLHPLSTLNTSSFVRAHDTNSHRDADWKDIAVSKINATDEIIRYTLVFPVQYTGTGKTFGFDLHYLGIGTPMFSFTTDLNQAVEKPASSSSEPIDDPNSNITRGTGFVLKSASYGEGSIQAGGRFTLEAVMLSTNGTQNVENVYVSITPAPEIGLAGGNSVVYVGTVAPNQEIPVTFDLEVGNVEKEGTYKVTMEVKGINAKSGEAVSATMDIAVPVTFPERFEIFNVQMPELLTAGGMDGGGYASVTLVNKGKSAIHNVTASITGDGLSAQEGEQFVGNVNASAQSSVDFTILAEYPGELNGQIVIKYEDAKGKEKILTHPFTVTADEMIIESDSYIDEPIDETPKGLPGWAWVLIILAAAGACVAVVVLVLKKRKAKQDEALADEYNEDEPDENF